MFSFRSDQFWNNLGQGHLQIFFGWFLECTRKVYTSFELLDCFQIVFGSLGQFQTTFGVLSFQDHFRIVSDCIRKVPQYLGRFVFAVSDGLLFSRRCDRRFHCRHRPCHHRRQRHRRKRKFQCSFAGSSEGA